MTPIISQIPPEKISAWVYKNFHECKPRKEGDELRINNPFNGDEGLHFNISVIKGCVHDFRGDSWAGYNLAGNPQKKTFIRFVQKYLTQQRGRCSFSEALQDVLGVSSGALSLMKWQKRRLLPETKDEASLELPEGTIEFNTTSQLSSGLLSWLASRGVDDKKIKKFKIMHSGFDIVWPYYEYDPDTIVYWQSRSRINKIFRFPSESIGVTKGQFFYGFDQVEPASFIIITESIFNCLTLEDQCLATGGASLTETQVKKIKLLGPREGIILAPDHDKAGIESIAHNANMLQSLGYKIFYALPPIIKLPDGKMSNDWNDLIKVTNIKEIRSIFEKSVKSYNFQQKLYLEDRLKQLSRPKIICQGY